MTPSHSIPSQPAASDFSYPHPIFARNSISLFYPMYNERESVEPMTRKALEVLQCLTPDFELLIIDDGSTDGSSAIADQLAKLDSRIRVIHHARNMGYGQALRTGFAAAEKDIVAYTDCDQPVDLWKLQDAIPLLETADMVIGYRQERWEGWLRFIYSAGYNTLVRLLFGVHARDINFSFKMLYRNKLRQFVLGAGSVFIDGELLAEAARCKLQIREIPIKYQQREFGESKFNNLKAATDTLEEIFAYAIRRRTVLKQMPIA